MEYEKFVKREASANAQTIDITKIEERSNISNWVCIENGKSYIKNKDSLKILLPITEICCAAETQVGTKMYCFNNRKCAVVYNEYFEMIKFFKLPQILPESLVYYEESLFAAISATKDEIVSFKVGGRNADSPFLIGKYSVCIRLEDPQYIYASPEGLYVVYTPENKTVFLKPIGGG